MKMSGATMLVTGGTSGIGRALAEAFHDRGNQVIVAGRRRDLLEEVVSGSPGIVGMTLDVADARSVALFAGELGERFPSSTSSSPMRASLGPRTSPPMTGTRRPPRPLWPPTSSARCG